MHLGAWSAATALWAEILRGSYVYSSMGGIVEKKVFKVVGKGHHGDKHRGLALDLLRIGL